MQVRFGGTVFAQRDGSEQRDKAIKGIYGFEGSSVIDAPGAVIKFYPRGDAREGKAVEAFKAAGIPVKQTDEIMNWKTAPVAARTIFNA
jgi:hypothetical protein